MKNILFIFFVVLSVPLLKAQDMETVDATVSLYPKTFASADVLADFIKRDFKTQKEQLRAGYSWLIHNVSYEPKEFYDHKFQYRILEERNQKAAASRELIIERTVTAGLAVCEGYALTLERLCERLGINAYVVRGDTKTTIEDIERSFKKNHMWMVAIIDNKPVLCDPTWGAGRYNGAFIKDPSYFFFNTKPSLFLNTHCPEVFSDAYVMKSVSREAFAKRPLLIKKDLLPQEVSPKNGTLSGKQLSKGITFRLTLESAEALSYTLGNNQKVAVNAVMKDGKVTFEVSSKTKVDALVIYQNDQPIIGYKIKR